MHRLDLQLAHPAHLALADDGYDLLAGVDQLIDLENDLRKLVVEYSVIVGAQELSNRSDASLRGLNQYSYSNTGADFPDNVRAAAARLLARLAAPALPVERIQLPARIIERGSGELRP